MFLAIVKNKGGDSPETTNSPKKAGCGILASGKKNNGTSGIKCPHRWSFVFEEMDTGKPPLGFGGPKAGFIF
jgi:hypothetical protein